MGFSPDGRTLAAGYSRASNTSGGVVLWDLARRKRVVERPLPVTEGAVRSIAFSPDGKNLAAGYAYVHGYYSDGGMVIWDLAEHKRVMRAPLPRKDCQASFVAFSPDGKTLAVVYIIDPRVGGGVTLWDVAARKPATEKLLPVREGTVTSIAFSPDGKTLAAGYSPLRPSNGEGGIALWEVPQRKFLMQAPLDTRGIRVNKVAFSADGKTLAAGYFRNPPADGGVAVWSVADRRFLAQDRLPTVEGFLTSMVFSPDGSTIAAGYSPSYPTRSDGGIIVWDVAGRRPLIQARQQAPAGRANQVAFSRDGKSVATLFVRSARLVRLNEPERETLVSASFWNVADRKLVLEALWPVTYGSVTSVVVSPDFKILITGYTFPRGLTSANGLLLWDLERSPRGN
jgi:WD40 repeat protein